MKVEVAYANPDKQVIIEVDVPEKTTVKQAIIESQITEQFNEINLDDIDVGIFSKRASLDTLLNEGDRVEIYRPLTMDPKTARKLRAQRK